MAEVFFVSDTHLGHKNILNFTTHEGQRKLRPFRSLEEMHVTIADRWNSVVGPKDKVYHLGDVAFTQEALKIIGFLNGRKRLVRGNHDLFKLASYRNFFEEVYGVRQIDGFWLTHVPMHPDSLEGRAKANVHGHLHANVIDDPRYVNVCVEQINYTPISFDQIKEKL